MTDIIRETGKRLRNWDKWGDEDERGTLNYITPGAIVKAAELIKRGDVFSLEERPQGLKLVVLRGADLCNSPKHLLEDHAIGQRRRFRRGRH